MAASIAPWLTIASTYTKQLATTRISYAAAKSLISLSAAWKSGSNSSLAVELGGPA
jgi:hypothetical protein